MRCPICDSKTSTLETRLRPDKTVMRQRKCPAGHLLRTTERLDHVIERKQRRLTSTAIDALTQAFWGRK